MTAELNVEVVPISTLKLDRQNVRKHDARSIEAIARSLAEFGQRRPLVVRKNTVLAGNGTLQAAQSLGWQEVAITRVPADWSDAQARAFAIADNRTNELSEWDNEALLAALEDFDESLIEAAGFDPADLSTVAASLEVHAPAPGSADFVDVPEEDRYEQQYGVNVICTGPEDQMAVYEAVTAMGYKCRVVTV